jgi:hypothetical protein
MWISPLMLCVRFVIALSFLVSSLSPATNKMGLAWLSQGT